MLYDVEAASRDLSAEERAALRGEQSKPVLNDFESWLQEEKRKTLPKSPIGEAIAYALSNWVTPKSSTFTLPSLVMNRLSGLRSR